MFFAHYRYIKTPTLYNKEWEQAIQTILTVLEQVFHIQAYGNAVFSTCKININR